MPELGSNSVVGETQSQPGDPPVPASPVPGGWVLLVERKREEFRPGMNFRRTVGHYQVYRDGVAVDGLEGTTVERQGPGDNSGVGRDQHRCIEAGTYPLRSHRTDNYRTVDFETDGEHPRPSIEVGNTRQRTGILVHPASGYGSTIGCINLADTLDGPQSNFSLARSTQRVIAVIDSIKEHLGGTLPSAQGAPLAGCQLIVRDVAHAGLGVGAVAALAAAAAPVSAGDLLLSGTPVLATHRGTQPDLYVKWTDIPDPASPVDVVVHLHGFGDAGVDLQILEEVRRSGLDFSDPRAASPLARRRQTIGVVPRGDRQGERAYHFPALCTANGLATLMNYALGKAAVHVGVPQLRRGRFILTSHSGSGQDVENLLKVTSLQPDEVHLFDATYGAVRNIAGWAVGRMAADRTLLDGIDPASAMDLMRERGGALRAIFMPGTGTEANADVLAGKLAAALAGGGGASAILRRFYRVDSSNLGHFQIPKRFGFQLLADAAVAIAAPVSDLIMASPLKTGAGGELVRAWQAFLVAQGLRSEPPNAVFEAATASETIAFQHRHGLEADGVVGRDTVQMALSLGLDHPPAGAAAGAMAAAAAPSAQPVGPPQKFETQKSSSHNSGGNSTTSGLSGTLQAFDDGSIVIDATEALCASRTGQFQNRTLVASQRRVERGGVIEVEQQNYSYGGRTLPTATAWRHSADFPPAPPGFSATDVRDVTASQFGKNDTQDEGTGSPRMGLVQTNSEVFGASIKVTAMERVFGAGWASDPRRLGALIEVHRAANSRLVRVPLVDLGPAEQVRAEVDLSWACDQFLGTAGQAKVRYRVLIPDPAVAVASIGASAAMPMLAAVAGNAHSSNSKSSRRGKATAMTCSCNADSSSAMGGRTFTAVPVLGASMATMSAAMAAAAAPRSAIETQHVSAFGDMLVSKQTPGAGTVDIKGNLGFVSVDLTISIAVNGSAITVGIEVREPIKLPKTEWVFGAVGNSLVLASGQSTAGLMAASFDWSCVLKCGGDQITPVLVKCLPSLLGGPQAFVTCVIGQLAANSGEIAKCIASGCL